MTSEYTSDEPMQELREILIRLVKSMTRRVWANPRLMQMDVGKAIALLGRVDFPSSILLQRALPDLLRELAHKKPDFHRYILVLEDAARELGEILRENAAEDEPWKARED